MAGFELISRRVFLKELGLGTVALVVFGAAGVACSSGKDLTWNRVQLLGVSAYLLVRNGEIALINTGFNNSTPAIAAGIAAIGLGWTNVGHIIITHSHRDHFGGIEAAMQAAPQLRIGCARQDTW